MIEKVDNFLYKGLRKKLVDNLRNKGITNENVLQAIENVPRHFFVPFGLENIAYEDQALPLSDGQTISQPYTVAFQTQLLDVQPGMKVLEIGTGSGYQAAILAELGAKVYSIERITKLHKTAQYTLSSLGYQKCQLFLGDGYLGKEAYAPYHRIIVTCGAVEIPQNLIKQLAVGGKMVIPVGINTQEMLLVVKLNEHDVEITKHGNFVFVPFVKGS
ncbi:MAG: protein-L-isoaspartate(D-aspartate) O-methyltransferase [Bacteroidales bacterium]|nr:protein-L-isoaspartate(D-aspartate) O-methyltransferase [Bacteroidales bacterium]